jgi:hypothetical protein
MNDEQLTRSLDRGVEARVAGTRLRPDVDDLFRRSERRAAHDRRLKSALLVIFLAVGGVAGYAIGKSDSSTEPPPLAVASDAAFDRAPRPAAVAPADLQAARAGVTRAFETAYTGSVPEARRTAAIQQGATLEARRRQIVAVAQAHGYTAEQFAGTTIDILDVQFIDEDHAVVRFTLTVPGHGAVLVDRVGYAMREDGEWKVALRTACDLLSLGGAAGACPPG